MAALWTTLAPILPVRGETTRTPGETTSPAEKVDINQVVAVNNRTTHTPVGGAILPPSGGGSLDWLKAIGFKDMVQPSWPAAGLLGDGSVTTLGCNSTCVCTRRAGGDVKVECTKPGTLLTLPDLGPENANVTEL